MNTDEMDDTLKQIDEAIMDADEDYAMSVLADYPNLDVNRAWEGEHLITQACQHDMPQLVKALIDRGAVVDRTDSRGDTGLAIACWQGYVAVINTLLDHGASTIPLDPQRMTPLHGAAQRGLETVVVRLLDAGAPINAHHPVHGTPLHMAINAQRSGLIPLLLARGASLDAVNGRGQTPVMLARDRDEPEMANALLKHEQKGLQALLNEGSFAAGRPGPRL